MAATREQAQRQTDWVQRRAAEWDAEYRRRRARDAVGRCPFASMLKGGDECVRNCRRGKSPCTHQGQ